MDTISNLNDKFSWRRSMSVGYLYADSIKIHIAICIAVALIAGLLTMTVDSDDVFHSPLYLTANTIMGIVVYLSPLAFSRRDDSLLGQLPASPLEKWIFYMLYCIIFIPVIMNGVWYGVNGILCLFGKGLSIGEIYETARNMVARVSPSLFPSSPVYILMSLVQSICYMSFILYFVLRASKHRALKAILAFIIINLAISLFFGIVGIVIGIYKAVHAETADISVDIVSSMPPIIYGAYVLYAIFAVTMCRLSYKLLAKGQIKN